MKFSIRFLMSLILIVIVSVTWIHLPNSHITFVFLYLPIALIMSITAIVCSLFLILNLLKKDRYQSNKFVKSLLIALIIVVFPLISSGLVHLYNQNIAENLLEKVMTFRDSTGTYPENDSEIGRYKGLFGLHYHKYKDIDHFYISFNGGAESHTFYDSRWKEWTTRGWND